MILKSVGVLSAGKVSGALCAIIGLFIGAFMALMSLAGMALNAQGQGGGQTLPAVFVGVAAIVFIPIFYGVFGFVSGLIYAALYNVIAGMVGGLEVELEQPPTTFAAP